MHALSAVRRLTASALATALLAAPALALVTADSTWADHMRAARAALGRRDYASAGRDLAIVDSLVGGHAGAMSALASIAARAGDRASALAWLRALAATGLPRHVAADTAFARWADDPEFKAVAARLDSNATPIAAATIVARLPDPAMLSEDVAWDARRGRYLVSSIHHGSIVAIDSVGRASEFVHPGEPGVWGIYALGIDPRGGRLWATTAAGAEYEGFAPADSGRTALLAYDLATGRRVARIELPRAAERQVLGDLGVGPDGAVYVSTSLGGGVYRLRPGAAGLDTLAHAGTFGSPQSPALAADGRRLYVADYPRGIAAIDLASHAVRWLAKPHSLASVGIDGLLRDGNRLIAIQNGLVPHRVLILDLDTIGERIVDWHAVERASVWLGEPNHGTVVGRSFVFIGNSGWDRVGDDGVLATPAGARPPVLLRVPLGGPGSGGVPRR